MKALVLCNDTWHPAAVPRQGLARLAQEGFECEWLEELPAFGGGPGAVSEGNGSGRQVDDPTWLTRRLEAVPLFILTKSNNASAADPRPWAGPTVAQALLEYVRVGGGLLVIHSGAAGYAETPALRGLLGGVFTHHPPQCPVTYAPLAGHPLTMAPLEPFTLTDEHYFMALDDPHAAIFLTSASEHGEQPAGWTRTEGAGRVCLLTPGHNLEVWLHPTFQALLRRALDWIVVS
jgi:hypothetical protein